jgi:nucleoside-diphosphate-sugar epimerase
MNHGTQLNNQTFLITGASGFIGGRIIERLRHDHHCHIKALVHNLNHATRIARLKIKIIPGDILDKNLLADITKNVNYVIHCAVGTSPNAKLNRKITVEGTRNILQASQKNQVNRFVYLSTASVYGYPLPPVCNEKTPYQVVADDLYNHDKIAAEKIALKFTHRPLPLVILQPTIVYGPYSTPWTIRPIRQLQHHELFLVNHGQGLANPIYIDNLVDAIFLSLTKKAAANQKMIISDGQPITWKNFYEAYQKMTPQSQLSHYGLFHKYQLKLLSLPISLALKTTQITRNFFDPLSLLKTRPPLIDNAVIPLYQKAQSIENLSKDKNLQVFFQDKCVFEIEKAKKILGYSPKISFTQGMKLTKQWLKYARLI